MSVLRNEYDLENRVDETWYESSNVIYSKFVEDEKQNIGTLYIVFKGGKHYIYKGVSYFDYLSFKHGGLEGSSGKALYEFIIKKYPAEKTDDANLEELLERLNAPKPEENTYFIHGPKEYNEEIFQAYYIPTIQYFLENSSAAKFIAMLSDVYGVASFKYLLECGVGAERMTLYMSTIDEENVSEELQECRFIKIEVGDYDEEFLEIQMIKSSIEDIAYVGTEELEKIRFVSPSAYRIIKRRFF